MIKFIAGDRQSITNPAQALRLGELAEKHGYEIVLGRETFGTEFCLNLNDQSGKCMTWDNQENLPELSRGRLFSEVPLKYLVFGDAFTVILHEISFFSLFPYGDFRQ